MADELAQLQEQRLHYKLEKKKLRSEITEWEHAYEEEHGAPPDRDARKAIAFKYKRNKGLTRKLDELDHAITVAKQSAQDAGSSIQEEDESSHGNELPTDTHVVQADDSLLLSRAEINTEPENTVVEPVQEAELEERNQLEVEPALATPKASEPIDEAPDDDVKDAHESPRSASPVEGSHEEDAQAVVPDAIDVPVSEEQEGESNDPGPQNDHAREGSAILVDESHETEAAVPASTQESEFNSNVKEGDDASEPNAEKTLVDDPHERRVVPEDDTEEVPPFGADAQVEYQDAKAGESSPAAGIDEVPVGANESDASSEVDDLMQRQAPPGMPSAPATVPSTFAPLEESVVSSDFGNLVHERGDASPEPAAVHPEEDARNEQMGAEQDRDKVDAEEDDDLEMDMQEDAGNPAHAIVDVHSAEVDEESTSSPGAVPNTSESSSGNSVGHVPADRPRSAASTFEPPPIAPIEPSLTAKDDDGNGDEKPYVPLDLAREKILKMLHEIIDVRTMSLQMLNKVNVKFKEIEEEAQAQVIQHLESVQEKAHQRRKRDRQLLLAKASEFNLYREWAEQTIGKLKATNQGLARTKADLLERIRVGLRDLEQQRDEDVEQIRTEYEGLKLQCKEELDNEKDHLKEQYKATLSFEKKMEKRFEVQRQLYFAQRIRFEREREHLDAQIRQLREHEQQLQTQKASLSRQQHVEGEAMEELRLESKQLRNEIETLKERNESLQDEFETAVRTKQQLETDLANLEAQLDERTKTLESRIEDLQQNGVVSDAGPGGSQLHDQLEVLRTKAAAADKEIEVLRAECEDWRVKYTKICKELEGKRRGIAIPPELSSSLRAAERSLQQKQEEMSAGKRKLDALEAEKDRVSKEIQQATIEKESIKAEIRQWTAQFEAEKGRQPGNREKAKIKDKYDIHKNCNRTIEDKTVELEPLTHQVQEHQTEYDQLRESHREAEAAVQGIEAEVKAASAKLLAEASESEEKFTALGIDIMDVEADTLQGLEDDKQVALLLLVLGKIQAKMREKDGVLSEMKSNEVRLRSQVDRLSTAYDTKRDDLHTVRDQYETKVRELTARVRELESVANRVEKHAKRKEGVYQTRIEVLEKRKQDQIDEIKKARVDLAEAHAQPLDKDVAESFFNQYMEFHDTSDRVKELEADQAVLKAKAEHNDTLEAEIEAATLTSNEIKSQMEGLESKNKILEAEITVQKDAEGVLKQNLDEERQMHAIKLVDEAAEYRQRQQLEELEALGVQKDDELEKKREELRSFQEKVDASERFVAELNERIQSLESAAAASAMSEDAKKTKETARRLKELVAEHEKLQKSYKDEMALRKKYYNVIEDMKGKVRVYCRVRPMLSSELERKDKMACVYPDEYTIKMVEKGKEFIFDQVFQPGSTQDQIFEDTSHLIQSAVDGYNVCIFAYGQTGSGKTFTMTGNDEHPGLIPRVISSIFDFKEQEKGTLDINISCYMLELYCDALCDLLEKRGSSERPKEMNIKRDKKGMVYIENIVIRSAKNPKELHQIFDDGIANRHVRSTNMNSESSRSHMVFSILIDSMNKRSKSHALGKLSLVDLAGSERLAKTQLTTQQGLKEAQSINKSLSALGDVIAALSQEDEHVPYRNHPLTMLMSDSLGGNAKTLMFVNVSPSDWNTKETITSLMYATRVKMIKNSASKSEESDELRKYKKLFRKLKSQGVSIPDESDSSSDEGF